MLNVRNNILNLYRDEFNLKEISRKESFKLNNFLNKVISIELSIEEINKLAKYEDLLIPYTDNDVERKSFYDFSINKYFINYDEFKKAKENNKKLILYIYNPEKKYFNDTSDDYKFYNEIIIPKLNIITETLMNSDIYEVNIEKLLLFKESKFIKHKIDTIDITSLLINIDFNKYNKQEIFEDSFIFDIFTNKKLFSNIVKEDFDIILNDICKNGLSEPIIVHIDNGIFIPISYIDNLRLYICKILRLEEVPFILISSENKLFYNKFFFRDKIDDDMRRVNSGVFDIQNILAPYFVFVKSSIENPETAYANGILYDLKEYDKVESLYSYLNEYNMYVIK